MPQAVIAVEGLGAGIAAIFGAGVSGAAAITIGATALATAAVQVRRVTELKDPAQARRTNGREVLVNTTEGPRIGAYGEVAVGGVVTYQNSAGDELRELYVETVHTGHPIDSFRGWFIDDKFVPIADVDDINSAGDGSVDSDTNSHGFGPVDSTPVMYLRGHPGSTTQAVDSMLDTAFSDIGTNHRHRGCARTVSRFDLLDGAEDAYDGQAPRDIRPVIRGKLVYDPRKDSTFSGTWGTGSGSHRVNDSSTWEWSDNPALCWADYRIDSDLGPGWDTSRINYNSVAIAADVCDALVTIPPASPTTQEKRFRCNLVWDTSQEHDEIIRNILATFDARQRDFNGQWHVYASAWQTTDFSLDDDDLIGDYEWRKQPETKDRYNRVKGFFIDPDRSWLRNPYLTVNDTTTRTNRDNGKIRPKVLDLPGVTSEYQAQRLAYRKLNQCVHSGLLKFPMGYQGIDRRVGDTGTITLEDIGLSSQVFRVEDLEFVDYEGVVLTLKEDGSGAYAGPAVGEYGTRSLAGVITFPRIRFDSTFDGGSLLADPFFQRSSALWDGTGFSDGDHLKYFWRTDNVTAPGTASISRTGGVRGGYLSMSNLDSGFLNVNSIPRSGSQFITGEYARLNIRIRKVANPTLTTGQFQVLVGSGDADGEIDVTAVSGILNIAHTDINSWTVDEWQEYELGPFQIANVAKSNPQKPYVIVSFGASIDDDMEFQIDACNVTRVASP